MDAFLAKDVEKIRYAVLGSAKLTEEQEFKVFKAVNRLAERYQTLFETHTALLNRAALAALDSGRIVRPTDGTRYATVGIDRGGVHTNVAVTERDFPHVFAAQDNVQALPVELEDEILAIAGKR